MWIKYPLVYLVHFILIHFSFLEILLVFVSEYIISCVLIAKLSPKSNLGFFLWMYIRQAFV